MHYRCVYLWTARKAAWHAHWDLTILNTTLVAGHEGGQEGGQEGIQEAEVGVEAVVPEIPVQMQEIIQNHWNSTNWPPAIHPYVYMDTGVVILWLLLVYYVQPDLFHIL